MSSDPLKEKIHKTTMMNFESRYLNPHTYLNYVLRRILPGHKPDFIIVGAQKAGTSSLYYYLSQHPKLLASQNKEMAYFNRDDNFEKGRNWYQKAFIDTQRIFGDYLRFEATPDYLYRPIAAMRMHEEYPGLKIIILLRDPVKRAFSAWNMYRDFSKAPNGKLPERIYNGYIKDKENCILKEFYTSKIFPDFDTCIEREFNRIENNSSQEEPSLIRRGIYYPQIKLYIDLYGVSNVLIIGFKDLVQKPKHTLNNVLSFLNLPLSKLDFLNLEKQNARKYTVEINPKTQRKLLTFYESHNEKLYTLLGGPINW